MEAANSGKCEPFTMTVIGKLYDDGDGVPQNYNEAMKWYHQAAEKGEAVAMNNIAIMYANGEGVTKDLVTAKSQLQKSADAGYEPARQSLQEINQASETSHNSNNSFMTDFITWFIIGGLFFVFPPSGIVAVVLYFKFKNQAQLLNNKAYIL